MMPQIISDKFQLYSIQLYIVPPSLPWDASAKNEHLFLFRRKKFHTEFFKDLSVKTGAGYLKENLMPMAHSTAK